MDVIEPLVRHFLGIFFVMIGLQFTARTLGLYDRLRFSHIHYGTAGSAPWWHRQIFNVFRAGILLVCVIRMFADIDPWLGVFPALYSGPVLLLGMLLMLTSFTVINYLQAYMHEDWRSGIDAQGHGQKLITSGPFSRSRNPTFIAVIAGQAGFFLALPSLFSLVCLLVGAAVIVRQAREEEKALSRTFGAEYDAYRARVPRWF